MGTPRPVFSVHKVWWSLVRGLSDPGAEITWSVACKLLLLALAAAVWRGRRGRTGGRAGDATGLCNPHGFSGAIGVAGRRSQLSLCAHQAGCPGQQSLLRCGYRVEVPAARVGPSIDRSVTRPCALRRFAREPF